MPEILTKHPDIVMKMLKSAGAKCGEGEPSILKNCPKNQFCALPNGEFCIYGINDVASMTQISAAEMAEITGGFPSIFSGWNIILLAIACLFGLFFGMMLRKR
jgi:hypothetical protein